MRETEPRISELSPASGGTAAVRGQLVANPGGVTEAAGQDEVNWCFRATYEAEHFPVVTPLFSPNPQPRARPHAHSL